MRSYLNTEEVVALRGLPHATRTLYREGLRPFMNYVTGVVGLDRGNRLSYQKFYELLEVVPERGSTDVEFVPNRQTVREMLKRLGRAGMIVKIMGANGKALPLVFKLVFADTDSSRLAEQQPRSNQHEQPRSNQHEQPSAIGNLYNKNQQDSLCISSDEQPKNTTINLDEQQHISQKNGYEQHTTDIPLVSNNIYSESKAVDNYGDGYLIPDDWKPSDVLTKSLTDLGFTIGFILEKAVEFRLYWKDRAEARASWDEQFGWWVKKNIHERNNEFVAQLKA